MGCGTSKEKIENEMIQMKMARSEIQMERFNQMKLLKEIDGTELKAPIIPDYIDENFLKDKISKLNSSKKLTQEINSQKLLRPRRNKSFAIKRKNINNEEEPSTTKKRRKSTFRKKK